MTAMGSTQALNESMKNISKAMAKLNKSIELPELQKALRDFMKENEQMEIKNEMVGDAIDMAMDSAEDEEESDQMVNQILDEIGIKKADQLVAAPVAAQPVPVQEADDKALEERLANLKGS